MNGKAAHVLRAPDRKGRRVCSRHQPAATPAREFVPGFFTALVRLHNWPPNFQPQAEWAGKRVVAAEKIRANGGFDGAPLGLEGAKEHIQRWQAQAMAMLGAG